MCGIAGFVNLDPARPADERLARRMISRLVHRGPDDEGVHCEGPAGLGVRRLSIIDLVTGAQPISNEDGTIWIVFNGEVYDHAELRARLEAMGHRFRTRADTEVLIHLYEEEGDAFMGRVNAMAALALWDSRRRRLLLARDRIGKKPLHYAMTREALVFGSEIKALLEHPSVSARIDRASLARYLVNDFVPCPRTIYEGIRKIRPGHVAIFEKGHFEERAYWDLPAPDDPPPPRTRETEIEERVRARLSEAVASRLVADVPLGVFLSGGLDSSSIVACMARLGRGEVRTFSVAFAEPSFDESVYFRRVARHFGTRHEDRILTPSEMVGILPTVAGALDEPFGDASVLPTYLLSRFARDYVTVALGGEGGDELFAGYPTYVAHRLAGVYERLPSALRAGLVEPLIRRLPVSRSNISLDFRAKKFIEGAAYPAPIRNQIWLGSFTDEAALAVLEEGIRGSLSSLDLFEEAREHFARAPGRDLLDRLLYLDLKMYLQDGILVKVDRASMACSLEVRAPMLDYRFVELVSRLPSSWKLRGSTTKSLLRRAMGPWLPVGIARRRKKGFGVPIADWLRGPLRPMLLELLSAERLRRQALLDPRAVGALVETHLAGRRDNRKPLWTLLMLQLWAENHAAGTVA